ncbi:hypothetical protein D3C81_1101670 [compost metagenome]
MQALDCGLERVGQVWNSLERVVDQVDDDFGIGLRREHVAQVFELFTQLFVVLDDAVVHNRHITAREVWVSVAFGRRAMSSPTGVGDTQLADERLSSNGGFQLADLTDTAATLQFTLLAVNGQAGTVVPAVFEALEAFDQNGCDITLGYGTNDSTHVYCSWLIAAQIRLMPRA